MKLFELAYACRLYASFTGYDAQVEALRDATGGVVDPRNRVHCMELMKWLNAWGCRHLAKASHSMACEALQDWASSHLEILPAEGANLVNLDDTALGAVAEAAGGSLADIAKLNIFLVDLANFAKVNEIMAEYFTEPYPARAAIGVASFVRGLSEVGNVVLGLLLIGWSAAGIVVLHAQELEIPHALPFFIGAFILWIPVAWVLGKPISTDTK